MQGRPFVTSVFRLLRRLGAAGSALAGFEPALSFVDHVDAALAAHNAAIAVAVLERAKRVSNLHLVILMSRRCLMRHWVTVQIADAT